MGYGEDSTGKVVNHNGVWFAWDGFSQCVPHDILCRQPSFMEEETWREARKADMWEGGSQQNQLTLNEVAPKKVKDLYKLNVSMSNKEGNFDHRYHKPVNKKNSSDDALIEFFSEACVVLKKAEENWSSNNYRTVLRWKMKNDGVGKIRLKNDRKLKWEKIVSELGAKEK